MKLTGRGVNEAGDESSIKGALEETTRFAVNARTGPEGLGISELTTQCVKLCNLARMIDDCGPESKERWHVANSFIQKDSNRSLESMEGATGL